MRFAALLVMGMAGATCVAEDSVLCFKFEKGREFTGRLDFDEKLLGDSDGDHRRHHILDFTWTEDASAADGSCNVTVAYQRLRTERVNGNGRKTEQFDTRRSDSASGRSADYATAVRAVKGKSLTFKLHKDGRASNVKPPKLSSRMPEMTRISASVFLKSTMSTEDDFQPILTLLPQFSGETKRSGDSWQASEPRIVQENQSLKLTPTYSMGSVDPLVQLDAAYKWEQIKTPGGFMDKTLEVPRIAGSITFDPHKGCVVESSFEYEKNAVPLHIQHKGGSHRIQGTYKWKMTLKESKRE